MTLLARHPFKALYVLFALTTTAIKLPIWLVLLLLPGLRPVPQWSYEKALRNKLIRAVLHHIAKIELQVPLSLKPGKEGDRFVLLRPAPESFYQGPLASATTKPAVIGATWYPRPYSAPDTSPSTADAPIILHLHGGAFVIGTGRTADMGSLPSTLLAHTPATHILAPQYRLSGAPTHAPFPAALQDALTAYHHLLHDLHIPASRIILSGDSAGANIAVALLRYISEHGSSPGAGPERATPGPVLLPAPASALLWSPWVSPATAADKAAVRRNPHFGTDYLSADFGAWGSRCYAGDDSAVLHDPYVSAGDHPFRTRAPLWVQTGAKEVLFFDNVRFAQRMREVEGNVVGLEVLEDAPHDVAGAALVLGWQREFEGVARKAGEFVGRVGSGKA